ncbi:hypothetical protein [Halorubrum amylolyticum]|uniref:hypothetical protein n=1 Tax=Halorubrum amylolyticum TaxID=2508724 RepID=UPI0010089580|nr:hypothetical protein [Halorubrum amylolyticum]
MTALTEYELKPADVEFLLTVKDIEQNPNDYDNTEPGKSVANVSVLREETSLTKSQVAYRARDGENGRGFASDDMGILRVHPPTVESGSFGPRSVELTDKGRKVVSEVEAERSSPSAGSGSVSDPRIDELEQEISELSSNLENISQSIAEIEQSQMGAIDTDVADRLTAALRLFPRHQFVLSEILGVDMDTLAEADDLDSVDKDELRQEVLMTLSADAESDVTESGADDPEDILD